MQSTVVWQDELAFSAEIGGFELKLDATPQFGGRGLGPPPKGLLLTSLAGCTAMDVVTILSRMRVSLQGLSVEADGQVVADHPRRFERIVLRYRFAGSDLPSRKLRRAVRLSQEQYCGVSASLDPAIQLVTELYVNGEPLADEPASE